MRRRRRRRERKGAKCGPNSNVRPSRHGYRPGLGHLFAINSTRVLALIQPCFAIDLAIDLVIDLALDLAINLAIDLANGH